MLVRGLLCVTGVLRRVDVRRCERVLVAGEGPDRTRVELEHRNLDRHGPGWEAVRDGVTTDQGWPLYLDRYAAVLAERR